MWCHVGLRIAEKYICSEHLKKTCVVNQKEKRCLINKCPRRITSYSTSNQSNYI